MKKPSSTSSANNNHANQLNPNNPTYWSSRGEARPAPAPASPPPAPVTAPESQPTTAPSKST